MKRYSRSNLFMMAFCQVLFAFFIAADARATDVIDIAYDSWRVLALSSSGDRVVFSDSSSVLTANQLMIFDQTGGETVLIHPSVNRQFLEVSMSNRGDRIAFLECDVYMDDNLKRPCALVVYDLDADREIFRKELFERRSDNGEPKRGSYTAPHLQNSIVGGVYRLMKISGNGEFVVVAKGDDILLYEIATGTERVIARGMEISGSEDKESRNGTCFNPDISDDGRRVVFETTKKISRSDRSWTDIYLYDADKGGLRLLSTDPTLRRNLNRRFSSPRISGNGQIVVFFQTVRRDIRSKEVSQSGEVREGPVIGSTIVEAGTFYTDLSPSGSGMREVESPKLPTGQIFNRSFPPDYSLSTDGRYLMITEAIQAIGDVGVKATEPLLILVDLDSNAPELLSLRGLLNAEKWITGARITDNGKSIALRTADAFGHQLLITPLILP